MICPVIFVNNTLDITALACLIWQRFEWTKEMVQSIVRQVSLQSGENPMSHTFGKFTRLTRLTLHGIQLLQLVLTLSFLQGLELSNVSFHKSST